MARFKVGDRVMTTRECFDCYPPGAVGTVLEVYDYDYYCYVDFDDHPDVQVKANGTRHWYVTAAIAAPVAPTSRTNDPATSKGKRRINKYEQAVLDYLTKHGEEGGTGKSIAESTFTPLNCITPRFAPLRRKGLIKASGLRHDKQIVWVLA